MNSITRTPLRVRHETRLRLVQVSRVEQVSPLMRRITFTGAVLEGFTSMAPDDHVKLFLPEPGQDLPVLQVPSGERLTVPDGARRPIARDYTPRRFNPETCELVIEFVLHGDGPASTWAAQAKPGQSVGIGGPRGSLIIPEDYDAYLLAGDETALPAIARRLEEMAPGVPVIVLIEVADRREERHLPTAANARIRWLHRNGEATGTPSLLGTAVQSLDLPPGDIHAWIAAEIEVVRHLRRILIEERGLDRSQIKAAGYWRHGEAGAHSKIED
jgi:NADPH-dependent ferric siderophore reductase